MAISRDVRSVPDARTVYACDLPGLHALTFPSRARDRRGALRAFGKNEPSSTQRQQVPALALASAACSNLTFLFLRTGQEKWCCFGAVESRVELCPKRQGPVGERAKG